MLNIKFCRMMEKLNLVEPGELVSRKALDARKSRVKEKMLKTIIELESFEHPYEDIKKFNVTYGDGVSHPAGDEFEYAIGYIQKKSMKKGVIAKMMLR